MRLLGQTLHLGALALGTVLVVLSTVAYLLDWDEVAVLAAGAFGLLLLGLLVHLHARAGANFRQLTGLATSGGRERAKLGRGQATLDQRIKDTRRGDAEILALAEQMTPVITRTIARDWAVNASRISARYEMVEGQLRTLIDELVSHRSSLDEQARTLQDDAAQLLEALRKGVADEPVRLRRELERLRRLPDAGAMQRLSNQSVSEVDALLQIRDRFGVPDSVPLLSGWALSPRAMLHVLDLVSMDDAKVVVELGSGTSTIYMAEFFRRRGHGRVISLEHDSGYHVETSNYVARRGLEDYAEVRLAPLVNVDVGDATQAWYDPAQIQDLSAVDLLLVDGPPGATGELARYPALPMLDSRLAPHAVVVVDDASRSDEETAIARWCDERSWEVVPSAPGDFAVLRRSISAPS